MSEKNGKKALALVIAMLILAGILLAGGFVEFDDDDDGLKISDDSDEEKVEKVIDILLDSESVRYSKEWKYWFVSYKYSQGF